MRRKWLLMLAALAAVTLVDGCARPTAEERAGKAVSRLAGELDLSDAQVRQLEAMKEEFLKRQEELGQLRQETFDRLTALMRQERIDRTEVDSLVTSHQTEAAEMIRFLGDKLIEFHALLTPEQRAEVLGQLQEHREKWRGRWR